MSQDNNAEPAHPRSKMPMFILAGAVASVAIIALIVWYSGRDEVSTDDAFTDGNAVSISSKVSGYVLEMHIDDNVRIKKGDLLLKIEPRDYLAAQAQAAAQLADAKAQLASAEVSYQIAKVQYPAQLTAAKAQQRAAAAALRQSEASYRRQHGVDPRSTTQESIDSSETQTVQSASNLANARTQASIAQLVPEQLRQAAATVDQRSASVSRAMAQLDQANLNLEYTQIRAPADGFVTKRNVHVGSYLSAGTSLFLIVSPDIWVTANFKESQLGRMQPGDAVEIKIDAYPSLHLDGHVQSIQHGSGSRFSAFPTENATGNFVKIVQRVPVKITIDRGIDPNAPPPQGLSVTPVVHVR